MKKPTLSILFLLAILFSCQEEDFLPRGTQLMLNPNLSQFPDSVDPWKPSNPDGIQMGVSREVFVSGNRSLFVENPVREKASAAAWSQNYTGPMPEPGSTVELVAFIKGENVQDLTAGGRVYIMVRTFPQINQISGESTALDMQGDFDWVLVKATLDNFPKDAERIEVSLNVPTLTLGKIYFDEINLTVK
ncbi:hypothetical protein Aoki45_22760 [Algoriphagus sp. oki45]|uniref:hypothetical protein n=1 Tax=Algoriphagus sp. oki45 TaxID=3067294 RepID=UPI0027E89821|nr:hypothetical protein Aoki45_22760 [Algoriphagus sp. oki45]